MKFAMRPDLTLCQRVADRVWQLVVRRDVDLAEIYSALLMIGWGVQLVLPWDTFTSSLSYQAMAVLLPERLWGVLLGGIGTLHLAAYLFDLWIPRLVASVLTCMTWAFIGALFGFSNIQGVGWIVYAFLSLTSALVFWRVVIQRVSND